MVVFDDEIISSRSHRNNSILIIFCNFFHILQFFSYSAKRLIPNLLENKDFQCNFIIIIHNISHSFIWFHHHSHHSIFIHNISYSSQHMEIPKYLESSNIFGKFQNIWKVPKNLESSKKFGKFQKIWKVPKYLESSKILGHLQIICNSKISGKSCNVKTSNY